MAVDPVRARRGGQADVQPSVTAGEHRRIRKEDSRVLRVRRSAQLPAESDDEKAEEGRQKTGLMPASLCA